MVILKIDFDKSLPVEAVFLDLDTIQHIAGEIEVLLATDRIQLPSDVAFAFEQQTVPVLQSGLVQMQTRIFGEMGRAQQLAPKIIGPAVQRADDMLRMSLALE